MHTIESYLSNNSTIYELSSKEIENNFEAVVKFISKQKEDQTRQILYLLDKFSYLGKNKSNYHFLDLIAIGEISYSNLPNQLKDTHYNFISGIFNPHEVLHDKSLLKNKTWINEALRKTPHFYNKISAKFKKDNNFILNCLKNNGALFQYLEQDKKNDLSYCHQALFTYFSHIDMKVWNAIPKHITNDKEFALFYLNKSPNIFQHLSTELKNNPEVYELAIFKSPINFSYLREDLKNNKELAQTLTYSSAFSLDYLGIELLNDPDFLAPILSKKPDFIFKCGDKIKNDKKIAKIVLKQAILYNFLNNDPYISFFNDDIKQDKNLALLALKQDFSSIKYLPKKITQNKNIFLKYLETNKKNFHSDNFISLIDEDLFKDADIIISILKYYPYNLNKIIIDESIKNDKNLFDKIIQNTPNDKLFPLLKMFNFKEGEEKLMFEFLNKEYFLNLKETNFEKFEKLTQENISDIFYKNIMIKCNIHDYLETTILKNKLDNSLEKHISNKKQLKI